MGRERLQLFLKIIRGSYLGEKFNYKGETFSLEPMLVSPYDFIRKISKPKSEFEKLLFYLDVKDKGFKNEARTELYRTERGWIDQGIKGYGGFRIRKIEIGDKSFLVPVLSDRAVGVDTSSIEDTSTIFAFCFLADPKAGYIFLENHLRLPKAKDPTEYKWRKLNPELKAAFLKRFELFIRLFCEATLIVHTNAFISPRGKYANIFINLIDGCFTGYGHMAKQRAALKNEFFKLVDNTPTHCDADFSPLTPVKIVRFFVQTLAKQDQKITRPFTPLHVALKSHESEPIQIADIIVGAVAHKIRQSQSPPIVSPLFFDLRKIRHLGKEKWAKAYYWIKKEGG